MVTQKALNGTPSKTGSSIGREKEERRFLKNPGSALGRRRNLRIVNEANAQGAIRIAPHFLYLVEAASSAHSQLGSQVTWSKSSVPGLSPVAETSFRDASSFLLELRRSCMVFYGDFGGGCFPAATIRIGEDAVAVQYFLNHVDKF